MRVVAREDIRKTERHQMHISRHSRSQVAAVPCHKIVLEHLIDFLLLSVALGTDWQA